eukprot:GFYU01005401.1.p1 GENE.GFYU01005401.1~~GFYU01005401.1.p1  ORF type:complete len:181 (+),score=59.93 GFYU01005401.1:37-579(+)
MAAKNNKQSPSKPLSQRPWDFWFVVIFFLFLVIAWTVDIVNVVNPAGTITRENINTSWPPAFLREAFFFWCQFDPLLLSNPFWLKIMAAVSPYVYSPFYAVAMYAIANERNWIQQPCLLWAAFMIAYLSVIVTVVFFGDETERTPAPLIFLAAYGAYCAFPFVVIYRFWTPPYGAGQKQD